MVKIGNYILFQRDRKTTVEVFKGGVPTKQGGKPKRRVFHVGEYSWRSRCEHYDKFAEAFPLFNKSCLTIAGLVMSQGVFCKPAVNKQDETYGLAEEAKYRVDKFNQDENVNSKFHQSVVYMAKYGTVFWEATRTPEFTFRLHPYQKAIEPAATNEYGEITLWRQTEHNVPVAEWPDCHFITEDAETYLVPCSWDVTANSWPYGTSLGQGLETELDALLNVETNAKDYMLKQAWPYEVLALGNENSDVLESDYQTARSAWRNRSPGDGIATRNMPVEIIPGGTGSTPIRELAVLCELMKDNAHDGLMVAPISKLYNSTEASAKVLTKHIMTTLGQPMQWILKEHYEEYVLKPWLVGSRFSYKSCPKILFESPDVHKTEEGEYWALLVERQIQTPKQAAEHLGLEYDEDYWQRQEQQALMQKATGGEEQQEEQEGEVWEVRRKARGSRLRG